MTRRKLPLDELRHIQISGLEILHDICDRSGLRYFLAYGTLLGAVRHAGYIPWDDDIDVMMPRADYERLSELASMGIMTHYGWTLRERSMDADWPLPYAKLECVNTWVEDGFLTTLNLGVNVDIFPIDGRPRARWQRGAQTALIGLLRRIQTLRALRHRRGRHPFKATVIAALGGTLRLIPHKWILEPLILLAKCSDFERSARAGVLIGSYVWDAPRAFFEPGRLEAFEGSPRQVPSHTEGILERLYGDDYMTLPPVHKRATHHDFRAYMLDS